MVSSKDLLESFREVVTEVTQSETGSGIVSLKEDETELLKNLGVGETPVEMSTGVIVNGSVMITEEPLAGLETCIRKIDRHKRKAWLEIGMFGRTIQIMVGLEITEKT